MSYYINCLIVLSCQTKGCREVASFEVSRSTEGEVYCWDAAIKAGWEAGIHIHVE